MEPEQQEPAARGLFETIVFSLMGAFLTFFAVVFATLLALVVLTRDHARWAEPMLTSIKWVAAPAALLAFLFMMARLLRRER